MIKLKSPEEIRALKAGGKILSEILNSVAKMAHPGVTTAELNRAAEDLVRERGGEPSFLNYSSGDNPYPAALCTSVNSQVVHGIPGDYILKEGDIVGLDIGMRYPAKNGLYTDMAMTAAVGKVSKEAEDLIKVTKKALEIWINNIRAGAFLNEIARRVQGYVELNGFSIVRDLVGHGVGFGVHEEPAIPNYYVESPAIELKEGMVLALEPMINAGGCRVKTLSDGWTVVTADGSLSAHFEHTVAVTKRGCEILTK